MCFFLVDKVAGVKVEHALPLGHCHFERILSSGCCAPDRRERVFEFFEIDFENSVLLRKMVDAEAVRCLVRVVGVSVLCVRSSGGRLTPTSRPTFPFAAATRQFA